jgi:hypothetical protein
MSRRAALYPPPSKVLGWRCLKAILVSDSNALNATNKIGFPDETLFTAGKTPGLISKALDMAHFGIVVVLCGSSFRGELITSPEYRFRMYHNP